MRRRSWCGVMCVAAVLSTKDACAQMQMGAGQPGGMSMPMLMGPLGLDDVRNGSGTSWLPDETPMRGQMRTRGSWTTMFHGDLFLQAIDARGLRGGTQAGSVNWFMLTAQHADKQSALTLRGMFSAEALTVGRCGFPDLGQSGESCRGNALHDRQHPHDFFMELGVDYRRAVSSSVAWQLYGGPSGDPALGPSAFPHRPSAMPDLVAPISHHWLDSTHVSFGVITAGVYGRRWKVEASAFNGREPDDRRFNIDLAPLDSHSARVWWMPTRQWAVQVSAGRLRAVEARADGSREDQTRITASATYHRSTNGRLWATTMAWGRNQGDGVATNAALAETAIELSTRDVIFGRGEWVAKSARDLALESGDGDATFQLSKARAGYTRWLRAGSGLHVGVGIAAGWLFVPASLAPAYGGRAPVEFSVFVQVR